MRVLKTTAITATVGLALTLSPIIPEALTCTTAQRGPLYDTPTGFLEGGYYDPEDPPLVQPADKEGLQQAHRIGEHAFTTCIDKKGDEHIYELSLEDYEDLGKPNAHMPIKQTLRPLSELILQNI